MKKINILLGAALFTISCALFTSCDDILEENADSCPSQAVISSNDKSVEAALTGCCNSFPGS